MRGGGLALDLYFDLSGLKKPAILTGFLRATVSVEKREKPSSRCGPRVFTGDPSGIRTPDPLLKRQLLCRLS